jgi:methionine-gamma-lyase
MPRREVLVPVSTGMAALSAVLMAAVRAGTGHVVAARWTAEPTMCSSRRPSPLVSCWTSPPSRPGPVPVLVDNTFASPVLQPPIRHGATLVMHSATKYLGGRGVVMGGVIAGPEDWLERLRQVRALTGGLLHPFAAYLLHRGHDHCDAVRRGPRADLLL